MPGLADSSKDKAKDIKDVVKEATKAVNETPDGYDAVLAVVQFGRQSREDSDTLDSLKKIFTKNLFSEHGILVVTHGDDFKSHVGKTQTFADFCSQQKGLLNKLWKECKKRVVLFDNATRSDQEKETQREELFDLVDDLIGKNKRKKRYTSEMFHAAKTKRDELIAKSEELVLTDEMKSTLRLLMHDLNSVKFETPDESITQLREIKTKTQEFMVETKLKDTKVKKMKAVLTMAESIKKATERKMKMAVLMMSLPNSENIDSKDKVVVKAEIELEEQYEILLEGDMSPKTIMAAAVLLVLGFGLPVAAGGAVVGAIVGAAKGATGRDVLPYAARGIGLALRVLPVSSIPGVEKVNEAIELKVKYCTAI